MFKFFSLDSEMCWLPPWSKFLNLGCFFLSQNYGLSNYFEFIAISIVIIAKICRKEKHLKKHKERTRVNFDQFMFSEMMINFP